MRPLTAEQVAIIRFYLSQDPRVTGVKHDGTYWCPAFHWFHFKDGQGFYIGGMN